MGEFDTIGRNIRKDVPKDKIVIPYRWVSTCKWNDEGRLTKYKARLVGWVFFNGSEVYRKKKRLIGA